MAEAARIVIDAQLQFRHDSEAAWLEHDPVLKAGEPAYTLGYPDRFKLGDGQSKWSELPYIKPGEGGGGGGGGGSQSYESLSWQAIKGLTQADPAVLAQAFALKQAYDEIVDLIPSLEEYYTKDATDDLLAAKAKQSDFEVLEELVGTMDGTIGQQSTAIKANADAITRLTTTVDGISVGLDDLLADYTALEEIVSAIPTTYATIKALSDETAARVMWQNGINNDIGAIQEDLRVIQEDYINHAELLNAIDALGVPALKTRVQSAEESIGQIFDFLPGDIQEGDILATRTWVNQFSFATEEDVKKVSDLLNDMFTLEGDTIQTKYNLTSLTEISASGAGEEGEEGGDGATTLDGLMDVQIGDMTGLSNEEKESQVLGYDNTLGMWINKVKMYHHKQTSASAEWVITHNLGKMPNVKIVDSLKQLCFGDVFFNDMNTVTIRFGVAESGDAYLD